MHTFSLENIDVMGLPTRQAETLAHIAVGHSAKETAREMNISPRTVEMNVNHAMLRLGARNRAHLITKAFATGILSTKKHSITALLLLIMCLNQSHVIDPEEATRPPARTIRIRTRRNHFAALPEVTV